MVINKVAEFAQQDGAYQIWNSSGNWLLHVKCSQGYISYGNGVKTSKSQHITRYSDGWHIKAETKLPPFRRRHFQMHFIEWDCLDFA